MKQFLAVALFLALTVSLSTGMTADEQAATQSYTAQDAATSQAHGTFSVELAKSLDSKKLKEGDEVQAKLTGSITLPSGATAPRGSMVIGHVTVAKARSQHDSESTLGIVFDKIMVGKGEEVPIKGVIQAVAPNPDAEVATGGGGIGYGDLKQATTMQSGMDTRSAPVPVLNDQSTGVLGFKNMTLKDGVITSTNKAIRFDSGTRFMLNVSMAS